MESPKILIVDDQIIIAMDIKKGLERMGYPDVEIVTSAGKVPGAVARLSPDLILMDVCLHDSIDGIDLADTINQGYNITIVFVTGSRDPVTIRRIEETKHAGTVFKPIQPNDLVHLIQCLLRCGRIRNRFHPSSRHGRAIGGATRAIPVTVEQKICIRPAVDK